MSTCLVPFNQLYVHSSGEVYPCSFVQNNPDFILGHIQEQALLDIWQGERAEKLRRDHQGQLPLACDQNQTNFSCHKTSLRHHFNYSASTIKRLDVMLDSACNLTCIMCTNIYDRTGGLRGDFFWTNNDETFAQLEELELVGGEPLISPHFERLTERVSKLNKHCQWRITTNANYQLTNRLITNLQMINLPSLTISLDSLEETVFQQIRLRSNYKLVRENIKQLGSLIPQLQINMVVQQLNADEVVAMYEWAKDQEFHFYPILLLYPVAHSLLQRPLSENKHWLLGLMQKNELLESKELFFLIKKAFQHLGLNRDPEIVENYYQQLKLMERIVA
jgi:radical SAM protein with 4Fe4S-binding SPASM domain